MILHENGVFLLKNNAFSYLLRVNTQGLLEQLHFGGEVELADAANFVVAAGPGWGCSVVLDDNDTGSCMDAMPLAWSGSGRGDYRETPLQVGASTDLRYAGFEVLEGIAPMVSGLPQATDGGETLVITMAQPGLQVKLYFTLFDTALTRRTVVENTGDSDITVSKVMSAMLDLPGNFEMTTFDGGWIAEMRKHTVPVLDSRVVNESTTGFSSNRHNPGFLLSEPGATEVSGRVYGFNLVYSGNHYAAAPCRALPG